MAEEPEGGGPGVGESPEDREEARLPLGPFRPTPYLRRTRRRALIGDLARFPGELRGRITPLSDRQLDVLLRPGGWSVRQVVHHLADAHLCGYYRFKLASACREPEAPPFHGDRWAEMGDARKGSPVAPSLLLLRAVHVRWVRFLRTLGDEEFSMEYRDPARGAVTLETDLQYYAWHGRHHLAQILAVWRREGWPGGPTRPDAT